MPAAPNASNVETSPLFVAAMGWLVPGGGYWALGQRSRALVIGITIVCIWVLGLLIGGVRIIEVPKFDDEGNFIPGPYVQEQQMNGQIRRYRGGARLFDEVRRKPWSIAQVLAGPVAIASGAVSVHASRPDEMGEVSVPVPHARLWEIAVLYTAVAGMLNLIAIIDASHRARRGEAPSPALEAARARGVSA